MNRHLFPLVFVFLSIFSPSQSKEQLLGEYATIVIPEDWDTIPNFWIEMFNSLGYGATFDGGFYRSLNRKTSIEDNPFRPPSVSYKFNVVDNYRSGQDIKVVLESIATSMAGATSEGQVREFGYDDNSFDIRILELNAPYVDYEKGMVILKAEADVENQGLTINYSVIITLKFGWMQMNFTCLKKDFKSDNPIISNMISSIKIIDGMEYPTIQSSVSDKIDWSKALAVGFIAALGGWYIYWKRKNKAGK